MKSLFCITDNEQQAHALIADLKAGGLRDDQVSIVLMENSQSNATADDPHYTNRGGTGAAVGGAAGVSAGAAVGLAVALGAVPLAGPLLVAGPLLAMLGGAAIAGTTGAILGALVGAGLPQHRVKHYTDKLHEGSVIVAAHPPTAAMKSMAEEVFQRYGVAEVPERELNLSKS